MMMAIIYFKGDNGCYMLVMIMMVTSCVKADDDY